jgi:hypothetical protein
VIQHGHGFCSGENLRCNRGLSGDVALQDYDMPTRRCPRGRAEVAGVEEPETEAVCVGQEHAELGRDALAAQRQDEVCGCGQQGDIAPGDNDRPFRPKQHRRRSAIGSRGHAGRALNPPRHGIKPARCVRGGHEGIRAACSGAKGSLAQRQGHARGDKGRVVPQHQERIGLLDGLQCGGPYLPHDGQ